MRASVVRYPLAMLRRDFVFGAGGLAVASSCRLPATGTAVAVEQPAPPFSLPDQHGNVVPLASLIARGPAVLIFYRGAW